MIDKTTAAAAVFSGSALRPEPPAQENSELLTRAEEIAGTAGDTVSLSPAARALSQSVEAAGEASSLGEQGEQGEPATTPAGTATGNDSRSGSVDLRA